MLRWSGCRFGRSRSLLSKMKSKILSERSAMVQRTLANLDFCGFSLQRKLRFHSVYHSRGQMSSGSAYRRCRNGSVGRCCSALEHTSSGFRPDRRCKSSQRRWNPSAGSSGRENRRRKCWSDSRFARSISRR